MTYYQLIKNLFGEDDFAKLLRGEPIQHDATVDISPASGFHYRQRKALRSEQAIGSANNQASHPREKHGQ